MDENEPQERSFKHHSRRRPPMTFQRMPGEVFFRIVCHTSFVGGLLGEAGAVVQKLRSETSCRIHCEDQVPGSQHRVILILGSGSVDRKIWLSESEVCGVSCAQEAMIRVFARIWEVDAMNLAVGCEGEEAFCGLLADTTQIGAVVGKSGKNITRMREMSGASIIILPPPSCARKDEELIQITGNNLAVLKALVAVSQCLQDFPPIDKGKITIPLSRPVVRGSASMGTEPNPYAEFFPHLCSFLPPISSHSACKGSNARFSVSNADGDSTQGANDKQKEVVFRLLFPNNAAGSIIGKGGTVVRALEKLAGASITFDPSCTEYGERVVTISSLENLESWHSPAQNAVVLVFARSVEANLHGSGLSKGMATSVQLLVKADEVSCLKENEGRVLSEMIEVTGSNIQILEDDPVSDLVQESAVQISGEYPSVQNAIFQVTGRLRNRLFSLLVQNEMRAGGTHGRGKQIPHQLTSLLSKVENKATTSQNIGTRSTIVNTGKQITSDVGSKLKRSLLHLLPHQEFRGEAISSGLHQLSLDCDEQKNVIRNEEMVLSDKASELDSANVIPTREIESGKKAAIVKSATIEFLVDGSAAGSFHGEDGCNLDHLRELSGAKIEVSDQRTERAELSVVISGTLVQIQAAEDMLQRIIQGSQ